MRPVVVLVGAPGAGKTAVGRLVASRLGVAFRDTDDDVVGRAGKTIADVFVDEGEAVFREWEREAVFTALRDHDGVLALGGGAVLDSTTRQRLTGHRVVWLAVGLADAAKRVGLARERPVLALNPRATMARLLGERTPLYAEVASFRVDTDGRNLDDVADDVCAAIAVTPT